MSLCIGHCTLKCRLSENAFQDSDFLSVEIIFFVILCFDITPIRPVILFDIEVT